MACKFSQSASERQPGRLVFGNRFGRRAQDHRWHVANPGTLGSESSTLPLRHTTPPDTIGSIIRKFKASGTVATQGGHGQKKNLSSATARFLRKQVNKTSRLTAKDLRHNLAGGGSDVSGGTACCTLHAEGFNTRTPRRTPLLKPSHKKSCFQYAEPILSNPQNFCNTVLWTDEAKLEFFGPMDQRFVLHRRIQAYAEKNTLPIVKHGGGSVMLWVCFASNGTGETPPC
ncbi:hypothetical protein Bbelb_289560 [Branchiostoma belcheri]|nr:hypothetical protein Bbelb_289560 [Branchiostoma belcheri]